MDAIIIVIVESMIFFRIINKVLIIYKLFIYNRYGPLNIGIKL